MRKKIKSYGVKGYLEYEAIIPGGGTYFRVRFEGGSITGYGVSPAIFSTADPVLQYVIEQSPQMARGLIFEL